MPPPLLSPVSLVGTQVQQAMGVLEQAQLLSQLAGGVPANSTLGVLRSVEAVPGVIAPADAARIRDLIQNGNEGEALQKLAAYHDVLVLAHQECVAGVPAAATLPLERIAALFGLAAGEFSPYYGANDATRGRVWSSAPALDEAAAPRVELDFQGVVREFRLSSPDHGRGLAIHVGRDG
ncbi:MAG TPA: hypothetical protein VFX30_13790, partial [bacterium]|nr:hypothetical protein [bacterium]